MQLKGKDRFDYIQLRKSQGYTQKQIATDPNILMDYNALRVWLSRNKKKYQQVIVPPLQTQVITTQSSSQTPLPASKPMMVETRNWDWRGSLMPSRWRRRLSRRWNTTALRMPGSV